MTTSRTESSPTQLPPPPARVHFIGIGGVSMSGLARILHDWGYGVSGSDRQASAATDGLLQLGISVQIGHDDGSLASAADMVVATPPAFTGAPVEIDAARASGVPILRRGQLLGLLANVREPIAAAGSHGKSTTSGMLTTALIEIGADPSYSVGATVGSTGRNADSGAGPYFVVEADEYDRALLWLEPRIGIVTSVAFDHPDIFADQQDYDQTFVDFAERIRPEGALVISADDAGCQRVLGRIRVQYPHLRVVTFGKDMDADWRFARNVDGRWLVHSPTGEVRGLGLHVPGEHNVANAVGAIAGMVDLGISVDDAIRGVEAFTGVGRRFEHKGTVAGVDVVDDYAHHPDEIRVTLAGARERFPDRRIVALFQPHTFSRTALLLDAFAQALDEADIPALVEIYPAREKNTFGVTSASVADRMTREAPVLPDAESAASFLAEMVKPGDVVLTMGAGDITAVGPALVEALRERSAATSAKGDDVKIPGTELKVQRAVPMRMYTTMRVGGPADLLVRVQTPEELVAALRWAENQDLPVTVIGGGSNLLVSDQGIRGLVIVSRTPGQRAGGLLEVVDEGETVLVTAAAQVPLSWLGRHAAEQGWAGLDWAVGLPGQVGGATVNNAGAHGTEVRDSIVEVEVYEDGSVRKHGRDWLQPTTRMTRIKGQQRPRPASVLRTTFHLPKGNRDALVALADEHADFRKRTQPTGACSGSIFVNPPGDFAGRLLEEVGIKGMKRGGIQFSEKHANWLVNTGDGRASDAWALIEKARGIILERHGIDLRPEIEQVGAWTDETDTTEQEHDQ